jgi:hypothetical protein
VLAGVLSVFLLIVWVFLTIRAFWPTKTETQHSPLVRLIVAGGFAVFVFGWFILGFMDKPNKALMSIFNLLSAGALAAAWIMGAIADMKSQD